MPSDVGPPGADHSATQSFADISIEDRAMRVIPAGPDFGRREGDAIVNMVAAALAAEDGGAVRCLILDFSRVDFLSSSGIGSCLAIHKGATKRKKKVIVCGLARDIADVFRVTRMDKLFKIADDERKLAKWIK